MRRSASSLRDQVLGGETCGDVAADQLRALREADSESASRPVVVAAVCGRDRREVLTSLERLSRGAPCDTVLGAIPRSSRGVSGASPRECRVAVVFGGESLYRGVASGLWDECALFRAEAKRCGAVFRACGLPTLDDAFLEGLFSGGLEPSSLDARSRNAAAFLVQHCVYRVVRDDWGLAPVACLGYSIGELAAAVACDVLSVEDVAALFAATTYDRFDDGTLPESLGAMAVVSNVGRPSLDAVLGAVGDPSLVVAAEYSSDARMLAGPRLSLLDAKARLEEAQGGNATVAVLKDVRNAYHSPLHAVTTDARRVRAAVLGPRRPTVKLFSCATGTEVVAEAQGNVQWWPDSIVDLGVLYGAPVQFKGAMDAMDAHVDVVLDLSLKGDLSYYSNAWKGTRTDAPKAIPTLRPNADAYTKLLLARADLARRGAAVDGPAASNAKPLRPRAP